MSRKDKSPVTKEQAKVAEEGGEVLVETPALVIAPLIKIRTLVNGHMDPSNAAIYIGRAVHTLAQWRCERRGPDFVRVNGRIFYPKAGLDKFMAGKPGPARATG